MTKIMRIDEMKNATSLNYGVAIWSYSYGEVVNANPSFAEKMDEKTYEDLLEGDLLELALYDFIERLKELSKRTGMSVELEVNDDDSSICLKLDGESMYGYCIMMTFIGNKEGILRSSIGNNDSGIAITLS